MPNVGGQWAAAYHSTWHATFIRSKWNNSEMTIRYETSPHAQNTIVVFAAD
ncbi:MAG: hypothetical protein NT013_01395 [Planctomycetia bacterium]|nr:hypothetical protein [Planctomycetia bacterium]